MGTKNIEAFYPLSPMQQGMLFHTLLAPQSGIYFQQWNCTLHGSVNADVLQQAWQEVVNRHSVLRTFFVWQDLKEPVQIVRQHVSLPWVSLDLRDVAPALQQQQLSEFLAEDLARGFDLQHAPLMRLALIRVADETYHFVWSYHHLLLDGWSTPLVIKEVFTFYEGLSEGRKVKLGAVRPYREYIRWLRGQDMGVAEQLWRKLLKGFSVPTALGLERSVTAGEDEQYEGQELSLTVEETAELQQLARTQQVTLNTVVQGAWALLLSLYGGSDDVVFGTTVSGRPASLPGVEEMVGLFINTLPVRVWVKSDERVGAYLRRFQEQQVEVRQYEYSPLADVQRWSEMGAGVRLFDTIVVFENTPLEETQSEMYGGLWISEVKYIERNNYSLTIVVIPGRNLRLQVWYDGRNYDAATTRRLLEHLRTLLGAIVANPQQKLGELSLLTEAERRHLVLEWNETTVDFPLSSCIHHLFEAQVRRSPDAVALRSAGRSLTFAQLDQRANQVAHYLLDSGIGPQSVVALLLDHSCETLIAILGVLKAGCAYLPLDPSHPPARMAFALADARAALLITTHALSERLGAGIAAHVPSGNGSAPPVSSMPPMLALDTDWQRCAKLATTAPSLPSLSSSTAAYLIYTSGSTGIPKGVVIEHASLVNYISWAQSVYLTEGTPADSALYSSLAFDLTVTSVFLPLVTGNTVHVYPQQDAGPSLLEVMEDNRCRLLKLTPSHLALICDLDNRDSRIRCLIVGGEALSTELAQAVSESFGHRVEIYNEYGPTEATVGCMIYRFDPETTDRAWVPIGRPAANTQIYILDKRLEPTAEHVTGELYIGGAGVARGYLGRAELTAARFVPDPFSGRAGARLYRTGDRARRLADGNLEYLGRNDEQVKYHGYRVELNELRLALSAHAKVRDAVVVLRKDGVGGREQLVGYYVGRQAIAAEELRRHMQERVIAETVPQWYVHLRRLPLTLNGKVNVEALPAPWVEENGAGKEGRGEPRTEAEKQLLAIWREVLGREQVRIDDNFFELGGDSILSIQIIARANRAGLQLLPRQLFQHPTVAALAAVAGTAPVTQSEQGEVRGAAALTPIQRWFFEQELAAPAHYNQSLLLQTRGPLQAAALQEAVRGLLRQHDGLRLRFEPGAAGEWRQWHAPLSEELVQQSCAVIALRSVADEELAAAITAAAEEVQRSLDLEHGPLFRVVWMETGAERNGRFLLVAHHLVVDGVSWRILLEDLERGYEQAAKGQAVALGAKTSSYREWAEALVAETERGLEAEEVRFWTEFARGPVPQISGEKRGTVGSADRVAVELSVARTLALLQEVPAAYNTQINDVLLAALMLAFTRYNGSRELLINLEGHGREEVDERLDVSRTVGWFTSIYPVSLQTSAELGHLLKETKESLRRIPRRGIGYGLLRYLSPESELGHELRALPQPEISFNYLGQLSQTVDASRLLEPASEFAGAEVDQGTRRPHLLDVNASVIEDRLRVQWTYNTKVHDRSEIERLANLYVAALEELVEHCLAPGAGGYTPSDFPLIHIEQQQLDTLVDNQKVDDIYPLSSTQEGILFHSIYDPELREYCVQINCTFQGTLNEPVLKRAWEEAVNRHSVLRTFFVWQDLKEPVQIVCQQVPLPWVSLDWRTLAPALQQQQLSEFLAADRTRGFDLQHAPLMRLALIQLEDETYYFVWSFQHLLLDGWSTSQVIKEVFTFYEGLSQGRKVELGAARLYREYIGWLRRQEMGVAEQFWRKLLKGFTAPTALGIERRMEAQESSEDTRERYVEHEVRLTAEATRELQQLARTQQVTLNTVVQGAWALLLSRYSGSEDVVFGTTVSGRPASLPGVEEMVGLFINTLPVRVAMKSEEKVGAYLRRLQEQQVEVQQYEYSPLVEVQKWSEVPKGTPLFESLLVCENYPVDAALGERSKELKVRHVKTFESSNYRLSLIVVPGQELILKFVHNSERYEAESIGRMVGHLEVVLHEMAAQPNRKPSSISMLTDPELEQVLFEWNGNRSEFLQEECLHQIFEAQVGRSPESVAAIYEEQSLTYYELNVRANQLAHYLQRLGVGPEVMVALCVERSLEMIVAQLAVLKAGGAYVPIDPAYPAVRVAWMCEDTNSRILLTQESVLTTVPATCTRVIRLDSEWPAIAAESELNPVSTVVAGNAAYVIYTSGSTGKSKGVIVTHANVLRLFAATRSWVNFDEHDVWTLFHSYAFDFSVWELWGALLHGARLVVVSFWVSRSPESFHRLLADAQVTILNQTPSAFRQLMLVEEASGLTEELNLRLIIFGGEALEPQSLEPWFARAARRPVQLVNMYGITETTVHITQHTVTEKELPARTGTVIGVPISDLQVYLLDRHLFPVPLGVIGEIHVGGPGVARGYLNQPSLTAERFIPHPFSQKTGERLYKSGDLGRYLANGEIEYVGRLDDQVKIRGFRVELAEIELVLNAHPAVRECVVVARRDSSEHKRLVSYVVAHDGATVNAGELRTHLSEKLPEYMIPSHTVWLNSIPLTPNGKIDHKALPDPHYAKSIATEQTLVDAPPLTPAERQRILYDWNDTRVEYPCERKLHDFFEARAEETPDAVAVVFEKEQLSYRELNARANQLAHHLKEQRVGPDVLVGVLMERSLEMVVVLLGILKAGGAYLPLDPSYPEERLRYMIDDARLRFLVSHQAVEAMLLALFSESSINVLMLDAEWAKVATQPVTATGVRTAPDNLAYVLYTSGSTGQPKGVMISQRAITNHMLWMHERFPMAAADAVLQKTPFSFDASVWEFYAPLLAGARLVMAQPGGHQDAAYLLEVMEHEGVTRLQVVPTLLRMLVSEGGLDRCTQLREVFSGGEVLGRELAESVLRAHSKVKLYNLYGPTEATIDATFCECDSTRYPNTAPIGFPIANTQTYLLDKDLEPVPCGVVGELYIGGDGLARGYFNRPELTAEKFLPNPFGERGGERLYRTGDLASYLPDGAIEYLGRIDDQIKIRGFRVEPGEIEAVLNQHPGIINSVVATTKNGNGEKHLVGYTMQKPGVVLSSSELRTYLLRKLPEHLIPTAFITLDAFPLTPNGKLDQQALPPPDSSLPKLDGSYIPPRSQREILLVQIWSEVLGVKQIGIDDNFFELGGDSILSIKIIARANRAGLKLLPRHLFQYPTVAGLAALAGTAQATHSEQGEVSGEAPLTPIQRWFFEQELAAPAHFNQSLLLQTRGQLQADAVKTAVRGLLRQHDALRLRFKRRSEWEWRQWHAPLSEELVEQSCTVIELNGVADEELGAAITAAAEEVQRSLDLQHGPVLRVVLMERGEGRSGRLLLVAHHLVVDGVSWRVLLEDLERGYVQAASGAAVELGAKTSSYKEWAEALVAEAERGLGAEEEQYWTAVASAQVAEIPRGDIAGGGTVGSADRVVVGLSAERTRQLLQEVPAAYNTQINDVLVTALGRTLSWWTTNAHRSENGAGAAVLVEMEGHGREEVSRSVDVSRTVGWFTSIYPVVLESKATEEVSAALKRIKEQLRAVPRRGLGFGLLRYLGSGETSTHLQDMRRAQVGFNYLGQLDQVVGQERWLGIAAESGGAERDASAQRVHAIEVSGYVVTGELRLSWEYDAGRYEREEMETVAGRYQQELEELIAHCVSEEAGGFTPSDFPLVGTEESDLEKAFAAVEFEERPAS